MIDELLQSQSVCWRSGQPRLIEELVPDPMELPKDDLLSLICNEVRLRDEIGQATTLADYQQRFPFLAGELETQWAIDALLDMRETANDADSTVGEEPRGSRSPQVPVPLPNSIGRYEILRLLGRGAASMVYEAFDANLNRSVAIKCLRTDYYRQANETQRFQLEAETVGRLRHPNIAQIFDSGREDSVNFIVMEYCERGTLADELAGEPLPIERALDIMLQLSSAVAAAHAQGIIHRDLKPANILLSGDDDRELKYKVTDFGLAKWMHAEASETTAGTVLGSPAYMPPEQASGTPSDVSYQADVYALGAIFFQLLTGRPPFLGSTIADTLHQIRYSDPLEVRQLNPQAPRDLETIVSKCLNKNSAARYESAKELREELTLFADGKPILAKPENWFQRILRLGKRNPQAAGLVGLSMGLLVIIAVGALLSASSLREQRNLARLAKMEALASEKIALEASLKSRRDEELIRKALEESKATQASRMQLLYRSLVDEAWSAFHSGMQGQRLSGLDALKRLIEVLPYDQLNPEQRLELRNVMAACLSLPDLRILKHLPSDRAAGHTVDIDPEFRVMALPDQDHTSVIQSLDTDERKKLINLENTNLESFSSRRWFSPCGRWLLEFQIPIDLDEKEVSVWDWQNERLALRCQASSQDSWCFHPDSQHLFVTHQARIHVYNLLTGQRIRQSPDNFKNTSISLSPKGEMLAAWGPGRPLTLHHPVSFEILDTAPVRDEVRFAAWCVSDQELWFSTAANDLLVWSPESSQIRKAPKGPRDSVRAFQFDNQGKMLAISGSSRTQLVNLLTNCEMLTFPGLALRVDSHQSQLVVKRDHQLLLQEMVPADCFHQWNQSVDYAEFSPSGQWLALSSAHGVVLLDCESLQFVSDLGLDPSGPAVWSPLEDELFTYGIFSHLCRWPARSQSDQTTLLGPPQPILLNPRMAKLGADNQVPQHDGRFCEWQSDGSFLYFSDNRHGRVFRMEAATGQAEMLFELRGVHRLAVSPEGELLAAMSLPREDTTVWDIAHQQQLAHYPSYGNPTFTADGRFLCMASRDEVVVVNTTDWSEAHRWSADIVHSAHPIPIAVHPNAKLLAVAVSGSRVKLLEIDSGNSLQDLIYRDAATVHWLSFSGDGNRLAVTRDETFSFWDLRKLSHSFVEMVPQAKELEEQISLPIVCLHKIAPAQSASRHYSFQINRGVDLLPAGRWWAGYQLLATFEAMQKNYPDAIGNLNYALQLALPEDTQSQADILVRRAQYHLAAGAHYAALNDLRRAIQLVPHHSPALSRLSELLLSGPVEVRDEQEGLLIRARLTD